jgi:hypothetical protein
MVGGVLEARCRGRVRGVGRGYLPGWAGGNGERGPGHRSPYSASTSIPRSSSRGAAADGCWIAVQPACSSSASSWPASSRERRGSPTIARSSRCPSWRRLVIAGALVCCSRALSPSRLPGDPAASRLWVADSKTETGIRHVEVTPKLRDLLLVHRAEKIRRGYPVGPDSPFFCTRTGRRWDDGNVRERVLDAGADLASQKLTESGMPPLPHVTAHTMRRTYVSIMLLATNFDLSFVQGQVGHTDSKLTMDVYAQLLDRSKRSHGVAFDALLSEAQATLYGAQNGDFGPLFGPPSDFGPSAGILASAENGLDTGETDDGPNRSSIEPRATEVVGPCGQEVGHRPGQRRASTAGCGLPAAASPAGLGAEGCRPRAG